MRNMLRKIVQITLACAVSFVFYIVTALITAAIAGEALESLRIVTTLLSSIIYMCIFCLVLIYLFYIRKSKGEDMALKDFENGYPGMKGDIALLFRREIKVLVAFVVINAACWSIISIDRLIFSRRTVSAVLLLYAPLNVIGEALPSFANGILGYLVGTVLCFAIYLFALLLFRKRWYKKWNEPEEKRAV